MSAAVAPQVTPCIEDELRSAGLRYVSDRSPGIRRTKRGDAWSYVLPSGETLRDERDLARIKALAIPPAWTDVWISTNARGHLQATGRDARGRKQYRYHAAWRAIRDASKFDRLAAFGRRLPTLRARVARDQELPGLPREKVIATVVKLLESTLIRVGNDEYARDNGSYGLTTLRNRHATVSADGIRFNFVGKGGKKHSIGVRSRRLARIVRRCRELPGQDLFQYVDDAGVPQTVGSGDVNDYLRDVMGESFTAKDFRTWQATVLMAAALAEQGPAATDAEAKRVVNAAIAETAERLGNTPAVCRKCYVHPLVIDQYMRGETIHRTRAVTDDDATSLSPRERAVLRMLESARDNALEVSRSA